MQTTYKDHTITVDPERFTFIISGPTCDEADKGRRYPSLKEAQNEVDNRLKAQAKCESKKLSLKVVTEDGEKAIVTGIHLQTAKLLGLKSESSVYPDRPFIAELLKELSQIRARSEKIRKIIDPMEIRFSRGYGRLTAEGYVGAINRLLYDAEKANELADRHPLSKPQKAGPGAGP